MAIGGHLLDAEVRSRLAHEAQTLLGLWGHSETVRLPMLWEKRNIRENSFEEASGAIESI